MDHTELILDRRSSMEREKIWMIQAFPQQHFFTEPLRAKVSSSCDSGESVDQRSITFIVLLLSSSGASLNILTATFFPFHSLFHRSVNPRVAKGISSRVLKSSSIRQDVGSFPNVPHNFRRILNAVPLRFPGMFGWRRICGETISFKPHQFRTTGRDSPPVRSIQ